jgi:hypothetical protein
VRRLRWQALAWFLWCGSASPLVAQDAKGQIDLGLFPLGGTFFVGGNGDDEVDFNVYTTGGHFTYFATERVAVEGELSISFGWAQDVTYHGATVFHGQMPNVWSYSGNVLFFPRGVTGRRLPYYLAGGIGAVALQSRDLTAPFGYDEETVGFETFLAENIGGGVKFVRGAVRSWAFRLDYRYLIVNEKDTAPEFFARSKTRGGHRLYFGVLFTPRR